MKRNKSKRHSENRMVNAHMQFARRNGAEIYNLGKGMTGQGIFSTSSLGGIESVWNPRRKHYNHSWA